MTVTTDNVKYAASAAITCTLAALATTSNGTGRQSNVVDNTTNLYDDAQLTIQIGTSASAIGSTKGCYVWLFGSEDGTNFEQDDATAGGGDSAYTINNPTNMRGPIFIYTPTISKTYNKIIPSVAAFFGGVLPRKWGVFVENDTNQNLVSGALSYSGITYTNQ